MTRKKGKGSANIGPWTCQACGSHNAGALVSRTSCDRCGAERCALIELVGGSDPGMGASATSSACNSGVLQRQFAEFDDEVVAAAGKAVRQFFSTEEFAGEFAAFDSHGMPTVCSSGEPLKRDVAKKIEKLHGSQMRILLEPALPQKQWKLPDGFWSHDSAQAALAGRGPPRVGIDFGGVITRGSFNPTQAPTLGDRPEDTAVFGPGAPEEQATDGVFGAVAALVRHFGPQHVFIVSKAGEKMAASSSKWLHDTDFFARTGFLNDGGHLFYVAERALKRTVVEALGISHFIDDRWNVLKLLPHCQHRYLFPSVYADNRVPRVLVFFGAVIVGGWECVLQDLQLSPLEVMPSVVAGAEPNLALGCGCASAVDVGSSS